MKTSAIPNQCTGVNEIFSQCGDDGCQRTCTRLDVSNCNPVCSAPRCICVAPYVRNSLGVCVLIETCRKWNIYILI